MMTEADDDLLDVRAAGTLARRSPETIRRWVWSGRLPARRERGRLLVRRADVTALVEQRGSGPLPTLRAWAESALNALERSRGKPGRSAADLVLEDRRSRSAAA